MPDREKVIKEIKELLNGYPVFIPEAAKRGLSDALALLKEQNGLMLALDQSNAVNGYLNAEVERLNGMLKEQEAVEPRVSSVEQRCGNCNKVIEMDGWKACPWCGKRIDWEWWWKKNGRKDKTNCNG